MSFSSNIREKLGLDYLSTDSSRPEVQSNNTGANAAGIERTLAAYGQPVLSKLDTAPGKQGRLFDLVDQTGLRIDTLLTITERLSTLGLVHIAENDKYGNHLVQLTKDGELLLRNG